MAGSSDIIVPAVLCVVFVLIGGALILVLALYWQKIFRRGSKEEDRLVDQEKAWPHSRDSSVQWDQNSRAPGSQQHSPSSSISSPPRTAGGYDPTMPKQTVR